MIFNNKRLDQLETEVRELGAELLKFKFRVVDLEKNKEDNFDRRKGKAWTETRKKSASNRKGGK